MKKVDLYYQCKICNLIKQDKSLWLDIHKKVLEEGISNSIVCKWLNTKVETLNISRKQKEKSLIPIFNGANFTSHFKKHISDTDKMKLELKEG